MTWAVVLSSPITSWTATLPSSHSGLSSRRYRSTEPSSEAAVIRASIGRWPILSAPSVSASSRWSAKLARASASSGVPAHQSRARNPAARPDAAAPGRARSTTTGAAPRTARKWATDAPTIPAPHTTIRGAVMPGGPPRAGGR